VSRSSIPQSTRTAASALAGAMFYRRLMTPDAPDADFITRQVDTVLGA
jgi:TetR/AcrR family transcriptional regulator, regulator of autoinduction and epiphytic fitness